jgi:methionine aminopeptidase
MKKIYTYRHTHIGALYDDYLILMDFYFHSTGIAFPTCVSVNNCICHFSPLKSDPDVTIKNGDVVKM